LVGYLQSEEVASGKKEEVASGKKKEVASGKKKNFWKRLLGKFY